MIGLIVWFVLVNFYVFSSDSFEFEILFFRFYSIGFFSAEDAEFFFCVVIYFSFGSCGFKEILVIIGGEIERRGRRVYYFNN